MNADRQLAQTFQVDIRGRITRIDFLGNRTSGWAPDSFNVSVFRGLNGARLARKTISLANLQADRAWVRVDFDIEQAAVTPRVTYAFVLSTTGGIVGWLGGHANPYPRGEAFTRQTGASWQKLGRIYDTDLTFRIYVCDEATAVEGRTWGRTKALFK